MPYLPQQKIVVHESRRHLNRRWLAQVISRSSHLQPGDHLSVVYPVMR